MARTVRLQGSLTVLMAFGLAAIVVGARPAPVQSNPDTTPWASPTPIATGLPEASRPTLVFTNDGTEYAAWESEGQIYYAVQSAGQGWSTSRRIATGIAPVILADDLGCLHILFANQFLGNYEIYDVSLKDSDWSLPVNVSHTSGFSAFPAAATGRDGVLYVAWMDNSPGYWTIYVGMWNGTYWSNKPVSNARGQAPVLASAPDDTLYLAWQDRVPDADNPTGTYEIFLSERTEAVWSLPVNISDRPSVESIGAHLTTTPDGLAHVTWVDGDQEVRYCFGQGLYWPYPTTVARAATVARGPHILAERNARLHIAWDEGNMVRATTATPAALIWPKPAVITSPTGDLRDVTLTLEVENGVSLSWIQTNQPRDVGIYESWRASEFTVRAWLPVILR
jgi:hypothetical protein